MNNNELKMKYAQLQRRIGSENIPDEENNALLAEKLKILQIAYKRLFSQFQNKIFDRNPQKYSTLLSYLKNIKDIQIKLNVSTDDTDEEIEKIHYQMQEVGLGWLLKKF